LFLIGQVNAIIDILKEEKQTIIVEFEKNDFATEQKEQIMKYQGKTIHKNKNSDTWYTRYRLNGKQIYISGKTQKDCYNKLKKAIAESQQQILTLPVIQQQNSITLIEWYNEWLKLYKINQVKQTTINDYKASLNNLDKELLNKPIKQIKLAEIINNLNRVKAERQRQKIYELLKMIYQKAEDNDIVDKNIINKIDRPKHTKENSQPLTREQENKLIEICTNIQHGDFYLVALYQGLRKGEILGLTIDNINFENKTITINKTFNKFNKFDTTKNKQSIRTMPMFEKTLTILNKYKNQTNRIFELTNKQLDMLTNKIKEQMQTNFKIKDLRSTFITRCQEEKIPEFVIQSWVGHKIGSKITSSVYTKYNAQDNNKYIDILNKSKFYSNSTHNKK